MMPLRSIIIFDLDGTLVNISLRRAHLEKKPPDWKSFDSDIGTDTLNTPIFELYKILWDARRHDLVIISGRKESQRDQTEKWLTWNSVPFRELFMRASGDFRPDHVVKEEILHALVKEGCRVLFVVDDRQQVVDMWRRHGITCLQCAEGNF